mmetsp:Transcript_19917/g.54812  ORF Transcript_19917/g.54812 Transcript_19917/m.54812 type:complete len:370 (-) Transcript_19917:71-1180(-)
MLGDLLRGHGTEGPGADVEDTLRPAHALVLESLHQVRGEVEAGRRRGHTADGVAGSVYRLVRRLVRLLRRAAYVGRQRHGAQLPEDRVRGRVRIAAPQAQRGLHPVRLALLAPHRMQALDGHAQPHPVGLEAAGPHGEPEAGRVHGAPHHAAPSLAIAGSSKHGGRVRVAGIGRQEHHLDRVRALLVGFLRKDAGGKDLGRVADQVGVRRKQTRQVDERPRKEVQRRRGRPGLLLRVRVRGLGERHEQARRPARRCREVGYEALRQLIAVVGRAYVWRVVGAPMRGHVQLEHALCQLEIELRDCRNGVGEDLCSHGGAILAVVGDLEVRVVVQPLRLGADGLDKLNGAPVGGNPEVAVQCQHALGVEGE